MSTFQLIPISDQDFAVHHAVYCQENIWFHFDWQQRLDNFRTDGNGCLLLKDNIPIGGAAITPDRITSPFLIPPFNSPVEFWQVLLPLCPRTGNRLLLQYIPASHEQTLMLLSAEKIREKCMMARPTQTFSVTLNQSFFFTEPNEQDMDEIVEVIYQAHSHGYVSTVEGEIDCEEIARATARRFAAFSQTGTLHWGRIVKKHSTGKIVAVCLTGIYPDSPNRFSTIHQVAVHPDYRRRGLAKSMMLRSISLAHESSPVITLGVLNGNPAKQLYTSLGFQSGPAYSDYLL